VALIKNDIFANLSPQKKLQEAFPLIEQQVLSAPLLSSR